MFHNAFELKSGSTTNTIDVNNQQVKYTLEITIESIQFTFIVTTKSKNLVCIAPATVHWSRIYTIYKIQRATKPTIGGSK